MVSGACFSEVSPLSNENGTGRKEKWMGAGLNPVSIDSCDWLAVATVLQRGKFTVIAASALKPVNFNASRRFSALPATFPPGLRCACSNRDFNVSAPLNGNKSHFSVLLHRIGNGFSLSRTTKTT